MHAAVCLLRAGQPKSASDAAKLGQFIGQFTWVTGDPIGLKGFYNIELILILSCSLSSVSGIRQSCLQVYNVKSQVKSQSLSLKFKWASQVKSHDQIEIFEQNFIVINKI